MKSYVFSFRPAGSGVERVTISVSTNKDKESFVVHGVEDSEGDVIACNLFPYCIHRPKDFGIEVTIEPYEKYDGFRRYELPIAIGVLMATGTETLPGIENYILAGRMDGKRIESFRGEALGAELAKKEGKVYITGEYSATNAASYNDGGTVCKAELLEDALAILRGTNSFDVLSAISAPRAMGDDGYRSDWDEYTISERERLGMEIVAAGGHPAILNNAYRSSCVRMIADLMPDLNNDEYNELLHNFSMRGYVAPTRRRPERSLSEYDSDGEIFGFGDEYEGFCPGVFAQTHHGVFGMPNIYEEGFRDFDKIKEAYETKVFRSTCKDGREMCFKSDFLPVFGIPSNYLNEHTMSAINIKDRISYLPKVTFDIATVHIGFDQATENEIEPIENVKARVAAAREMQMQRQGCLNESVPVDVIEKTLYPGLVVSEVIKQHNLKESAYEPVLRIARTIADLNGMDSISENHVTLACKYRFLDNVEY